MAPLRYSAIQSNALQLVWQWPINQLQPEAVSFGSKQFFILWAVSSLVLF